MMLGSIQQMTTHNLVEQENTAMQLPFMNLGDLLVDRPDLPMEKIEHVLLTLVKEMRDRANPVQYQWGEKVCPSVQPPNQTGLFPLLRFLEWQGKTVNHHKHVEHSPWWMEAQLQDPEGNALVIERPPLQINRNVTGMREYNTAFISAVEGKINRQAAAAASTAKRDDSSSLVLHIEGNITREMGEVQDFKEVLRRKCLTIHKQDIEPWYVLEGTTEQKNDYLQRLMMDNQPFGSVLQWSQEMGLYSNEAA